MISVNKQHYFINHILQKQKWKGMIQLKLSPTHNSE
jgi:hypothetical protein